MKTQGIIYITVICYLGALTSWSQDSSTNLFDKIVETIQYWDVEFQDRRAPIITAYSRPNFSGSRLELNHDWSSHHSEYWNDEIASIEVPNGYPCFAF